MKGGVFDEERDKESEEKVGKDREKCRQEKREGKKSNMMYAMSSLWLRNMGKEIETEIESYKLTKEELHLERWNCAHRTTKKLWQIWYTTETETNQKIKSDDRKEGSIKKTWEK